MIVCKEDEYRTVDDNKCNECQNIKCDAGQIRSGECSGTNNGYVCNADKVCAPGEYVSKKATFTTERECKKCAPSHFSDKQNQEQCTEWAKCAAGEKVVTVGSATKDLACGVCDDDTFMEKENHRQRLCNAQTVCGKGQRIDDDDNKVERRKCSECAEATFQDEEDHRLRECTTQTVCSPGEAYTLANEELKAPATCKECAGNTFVAEADHRIDTCTDQKVCGQGEFISAPSKTKAVECSSCESGYYQDATGHRNEECKAHTYCGVGEEVMAEPNLVEAIKCEECAENTYQNKAGELYCKEQPTCSKGQKITSDSKKSPRTCEACDDNTYQPETGHRDEACTAQPTCKTGQFMSEDTKKDERTCYDCPEDTFQDRESHREAECTEQQTCSPGQYISAPSPFTRQTCEACPNMQYQDAKEGHRETACKEQPSCDAGERLASANSKVRRAECERCPQDHFQNQEAHQIADCTPWSKCVTKNNKQYQVKKPTVFSDRVCGSNVKCNIDTQYEKQAPSPDRPRLCVALTACTRGQYISKQHRYASDRECSPCDGETEFQADENADACEEMSVCEAGQRVLKTGTAYSDLTCADCEKWEYREDSEHRFSECLIQPQCGAGEKITKPTTFTRQACEKCNDGSFQAKTKHQLVNCNEYKVLDCGPDQKMDSAGSVFVDQSCSPCPEGQWQWLDSHASEVCVPITTPTTTATTTPTTTTTITTTVTTTGTTSPTTTQTSTPLTTGTSTPTTSASSTPTSTTTTDTPREATTTTTLNISIAELVADLINPELLAEISGSGFLALEKMDEEEIILWVDKKNMQKEERDLELQLQAETEASAAADALAAEQPKKGPWAAVGVILVAAIIIFIVAIVVYRRHQRNIAVLKAAAPLSFVHGNASTGGTTESDADGTNAGMFKSLYGSLRGSGGMKGSRQSQQRPSTMLNMVYDGLPGGDDAADADAGVDLRKLSKSTGLQLVNPTYDAAAGGGAEGFYDSGFGMLADEVAYDVAQESAYMDTAPNATGGGVQESAYMDTAPWPNNVNGDDSEYLDTAPNHPADEPAYLDTVPEPAAASAVARPVTVFEPPEETTYASAADTFGGFNDAGDGGGYASSDAEEV